MKLIIKFIFILGMLVFQIIAQNYTLIGPPGNLPYSIEINPVNTSIVYAGINMGKFLFRTSNGGQTTEPLDVLFTNTLAINPVQSNIIYSGKFRSFDGGDTWMEMVLNSNPYLNEYEYIINPNNPLTVYSLEPWNEEIWKSINGGDSWNNIKTFNSSLSALNISLSDTNVLYCSADYLLYVSYNAGVDWQPVLDPYPIWVNKIIVNPLNGKSLLLSDYNTLYKSTDEGRTLTPLLSFNNGLADFVIDPNDTLTIYATGSNLNEYSSFYRTTDGGATWDTLNNGLPRIFAFFTTIALNPVNTNEIYIGVNFWGTYKTTDGGLNWQKTNLTTMGTADFYLDPDSAGHIYASIQGLGIKKSTDYGQNWKRLNVPIPAPGAGLFGEMAFHPVEINTIYVCDQANLHKTIDGGNNWTSTTLNYAGDAYLRSLAMDPYNPLHMLVGENGFVGAFLHNTYDDWGSWSSTHPFISNSYGKILFDPNHQDIIYIDAGNTGILKSTDGGVNWSKRNNGLITVGSDFLPLFLSTIEDTASTLYVAQQKYASSDTMGGILKSTNGGDSWFRIDQSLPYKSAQSVAVSPHDNNIIYAVIEDSGLYKADANGSTWIRVCKIDNPGANIKFDPFDVNKIYVNSEFGIIMVEDTITMNLLHTVKPIVPAVINLYQNYPNPFNPTTTISYTIPKSSTVLLELFNIQGRKVKNLENTFKNAGTYKFKINAGNLPSGVYLYRISTENYSAIKKMLLVK